MERRETETELDVSRIETSRRAALGTLGGGAVAAALAGVGIVGSGQRLLAQETTPTPAAGMGAGADPAAGSYLVLRTWAFKPDKAAADLAVLVRDGFVPIIEGTPGFQRYLIVWNEGTRLWTAISIFADKTGADESTVRAKDWAAANVPDFVEGDPTVADGQLILLASPANG